MQIDEDSVSSANWKGPIKLTVGTTPVPLTTAVKHAFRGIHLKANNNNTDVVYIGQSTTTGFPLAKGEDIFLPLDDPTLIFVIAGASSQVLHILIF